MRSIGADWTAVVANLLTEADRRQVVSLQVAVNTACPAVGAAVEVLREQGFFFCGLAPRWFGTDGVVMQKLSGTEPNFEETKLYSDTARDLLQYIRQDRETVLTGKAQTASKQPNCG